MKRAPDLGVFFFRVQEARGDPVDTYVSVNDTCCSAGMPLCARLDNTRRANSHNLASPAPVASSPFRDFTPIVRAA